MAAQTQGRIKTRHAPLVAMVAQRHRADCGAAVLAMLLHVSYEEALLALGESVPTMLRDGVWCTELTKAAARFGVTLKRKAVWDVEADEGIVRVSFKRGEGHVVLLRAGLIFDTDFTVWECDDWLKAKRAKAGALLARVDA